MIIYTDGSCKPSNPGYCGCGIVITELLDGKQQVKETMSVYLGEGTNNIAELTSIKLALEYLKKQTLEFESHTLYTDSNYAVGLLTKNWKASKNQELVKELRQLYSYFPQTEILWIKGHNKDRFNEMADSLANKAVDDNLKDI